MLAGCDDIASPYITTLMSSCDQGEQTGSSRPRLRLSVPTLNISRLASPLSSPRKEKEKKTKVSSSGREGLGNIRASKSQQFEKPGSSALHPPLSPTPLVSSPKGVSVSASESGSSAASLYSVGTGVDNRVSVSTTRSKFSWNRSTGDLRTIDTASGYNRSDETSSLYGSPRSSSFRSQLRESLFSTNSVNTFGIPRVPKASGSAGSKTSSQGRSPTSLEYARHIVTDTALRAEEKRLRAINGRIMSQASGTKADAVEKIRTGRGGAGTYTKVNKDIDAGLFPTTAALTREHDLRLAAQEKQIIEASRVRSEMVRRTGRGGLGNVSTRKGRERQEKRKSTVGSRKSDSELVKMSADTKGKRRRSSIAHDDRENEEQQVQDFHHTHRRSGSASSHTGSLSKRHSVRSKSAVQVRRKGITRLWSTVANIGTKSNRIRGNESTGFEIVELKPSVERDEERDGHLSPEAAAVSCIMSASAAASANRALALARLERGSRRLQLGEVPEEEAWVDDDRQETSATPIIPREDLKRHLQSPPSVYTSTTSAENRLLVPSHGSRRRPSEDSGKDAAWRHPFANAERETNVSRDSTGTFGLRKNSMAHEWDEDDAESIVDPYMHSP